MGICFKAGVLGRAANDVEIVAVHRAIRFHKLRNRHHLVKVLGTDHGVDVYAQPGILLSAGLNRLQGLKCLGKIPGHGANGILHLVQSIHGHVQVKLEFGVFFANARRPLGGAFGQQAVGRQVHPADAIVGVEKMDDVGEFAAQHGLAARKPQVSERRHAEGQLADFIPGQIAALVKLFPVKAGAALGVADGGDEENHRAQALLPPQGMIDFHQFGFVTGGHVVPAP